MYKVFIKVSYVELCFTFSHNAEAINFMTKAITRYDSERSEKDSIKVWMEIEPNMEQGDDF